MCMAANDLKRNLGDHPHPVTPAPRVALAGSFRPRALANPSDRAHGSAVIGSVWGTNERPIRPLSLLANALSTLIWRAVTQWLVAWFRQMASTNLESPGDTKPTAGLSCGLHLLCRVPTHPVLSKSYLHLKFSAIDPESEPPGLSHWTRNATGIGPGSPAVRRLGRAAEPSL
jgi:hypothetical protein